MIENQRWQLRFDSFERAFLLLKKTLDEKPLAQFSDLEKTGIIQRFVITYELAWKLMKDYLDYSGVALEQNTPRIVIKQAFIAKIIDDGDPWIKMVEHRNLVSHTYSEEYFEQTLLALETTYLDLFQNLLGLMKKEL